MLYLAVGDVVHNVATFPERILKFQRKTGSYVCNPNVSSWKGPVTCTLGEQIVGHDDEVAEVPNEQEAKDDDVSESGSNHGEKSESGSNHGEKTHKSGFQRKGHIVLRKAKERVWKLMDGDGANVYEGRPDGIPPKQLFILRFDKEARAYILTPIETNYRFTKRVLSKKPLDTIEKQLFSGEQQGYGEKKFNNMQGFDKNKDGKEGGSENAQALDRQNGAGKMKKRKTRESWSEMGKDDSSGDDYNSDDADKDTFTVTHGANGADVGDGTRSDDDDQPNEEAHFLPEFMISSDEEISDDDFDVTNSQSKPENKKASSAEKSTEDTSAAQGEDSVDIDALMKTQQYSAPNKRKRDRDEMEATNRPEKKRRIKKARPKLSEEGITELFTNHGPRILSRDFWRAYWGVIKENPEAKDILMELIKKMLNQEKSGEVYSSSQEPKIYFSLKKVKKG